MRQEIIDSFEKLSIEEKEDLVIRFMKELAERESKEHFQLSDEQKRQLDEAYEQAVKHPETCKSWKDIRKDLLS